jgi:hypothetical protein
MAYPCNDVDQSQKNLRGSRNDSRQMVAQVAMPSVPAAGDILPRLTHVEQILKKVCNSREI